MAKYRCTICGYIYDESLGAAEYGIAPGTKFSDLSDDFTCPMCGAEKVMFELLEEESQEPKVKRDIKLEHNDVELSPIEISIICSNLARGCEKQYQNDEAAKFHKLADLFKDISDKPKSATIESLKSTLKLDMDTLFPYVMEVAKDEKDRGALRALTWSEKVTKILYSILNSYEKNGKALLDDNKIWLCTICGYIYIGKEPLERCPVCKVPNSKFELM